ncbi:MAG: hypothetical protein ABMA13_20805 [Chthoniobacteraceae bacterium]
MHLRCASLLLLGVLLAACDRSSAPDFRTEVVRLNAELDTTRQKLSATEKELAARNDELARAAAAAFVIEAGKKEAADADKVMAQKDAQLRVAQAELALLKKSEAVAFAEASSYQAKELTTIALDRYQQFLKDHPKSPLVTDANRAIAELTITAEKEAKWRANLIDPKREEREILKRLADGIVTIEEIAPILKRRTIDEVVKMLGSPNKSFRNGTELGYVDKVIDSATGNRATLVIIFSEGRAKSLRVGYQGREIKL